jgi:hypothetical protein
VFALLAFINSGTLGRFVVIVINSLLLRPTVCCSSRNSFHLQDTLRRLGQDMQQPERRGLTIVQQFGSLDVWRIQ